MARPFRFTFILALAAIGTVLAAAGGWRYARASAPVNGPIILISVDTLRADHLPTYGYRKIKTPAIDMLAADGTVFERAYSHTPLTLPAHVSLLSGRLPFETGVRDDVGFAIKDSERLLPQMLRDRGFTTGAVVSSSLLRKETGINRGFEFFDADMPPNLEDLFVEPLQRNGAESEAIAERWLERQRSSRVFLFLHLNEPHKPYSPPDEYAQFGPYDGEIAYADAIVGRLIRYLKSHQLYDRSTIILLSDHGEGLGDHGEQEHGLFVYDETIHVPLIVKQAGGTGSGRRVNDVVQHIDVVPTILDLAKAPIPGGLRGRSLKDALDGTGNLQEPAVYGEAMYAHYHFGWSPILAITGGRYRYVKAPIEELYDLQRDRQEHDNVAALNAQARQIGRSALAALHVPPGADDSSIDPKERSELVETFRHAMDLAADRKWTPAIALLQQVARATPDVDEVWRRLAEYAFRVDRFEVAVDAYNHLAELAPADPSPHIGAATALFRWRKLDESREHANTALDVAPEQDTHSHATARELLARIALARHDAGTARREAELARQENPDLPMPAFVEGRLLDEQGRHADALLYFEEAIATTKESPAVRIAGLHLFTGETLMRLDRPSEAEGEFLQEVLDFPLNIRARGNLATLYHKAGRADDAEQAIADLIRVTPTADAYALAARLWTAFGNPRRADAVRAEARHTFAESNRPAHAPAH